MSREPDTDEKRRDEKKDGTAAPGSSASLSTKDRAGTKASAVDIDHSLENAPGEKSGNLFDKTTPSLHAAGTNDGAVAAERRLSQPGARRVYPQARQRDEDDDDASNSSDNRWNDAAAVGIAAVASGARRDRDTDVEAPANAWMASDQTGFDAVLMGEAITSESSPSTGAPIISSLDLPASHADDVVGVQAVNGFFIKRRRVVWLLVGLAALICLIVGVLSKTVRPSPAPEALASSFHLPAALEKVVLSLPNYTQETLRSELPSSAQNIDWYKDDLWSPNNAFQPVSSQGKAWKWLMSDPNLQSRDSRDVTYRFALATFYFATNGPGWRNNSNWLSRNEDICTWWHSETASYSQNHGYNDRCRRAGFAALNIPDNNLIGTIPAELSLISSLTLVKLFSNSLRGTVPDDVWKSWKGLDVLQIHENFLTGTLPTIIGEFQRLLYFFVHLNSFTGTLPTELGNPKELKQILISNNRINGTIPTELGRLKSSLSVIFEAANNTLTGSIPTELGKASQLRYFDVRDNRLSGSIPSQLGSCTNLFFLLAANNGLTGSIPSELGRMTGLLILDLSDNNLTGTLPSQLGLLTGLTSFDVAKNRVRGSFPTEAGQLVQLSSLRLSHTRVRGSIPEKLCLALSPQSGINEIVVDCDKVQCACSCTCG